MITVSEGDTGPSRRTLLSAAAAVVLLSGCGPTTSQPEQSSAGNRSAPYTIDDLLTQQTFFIAHRGSGDNWTEHTMNAYRNAVEAGAMAIEVSVHATKDGVLVCHHDGNLRRMTGVDRDIAETTWAELDAIRNDARRWLGPATALQPIPRLRDVLAAFGNSHVMFVEDKTGDHDRELLDEIFRHSSAVDHVVWKQHVGGPNLDAAVRRGLRTWGYFTTSDLDVFERYKDRFDLLGLVREADDDTFRRFVATGKPVISWEVHRRSDLIRLTGLGVRGMMCSNFPYVSTAGPLLTQDQFGSGRRSAGDLPYILGGAWVTQPELLAKESACRIAHPTNTSYVLGSLSPASRDRYSIRWSMRWPSRLPQQRQHAGIAFGQASDAIYRPTVAGEVGGYHVVLRANGQVGLYRREAGQAAGTLLTDFRSATPKVGEWVTLVVDLTRTTLTISRKGDAGWIAGAQDDHYRGGYLSLCKNYTGAVPVDFRDIRLE